MNYLELLKQRRIWAGIVGVIAFGLTAFKAPYSLPETATLIDLLTTFGGSISAVISGGLALWSYFKPKQ